ncbi:FkbM family methyltransferase [Flavobacterium sp.]|uniref:FkbM family methyltransferase n=1 Tax=Flavobacterium sp. TaxID=239 RepID=UPI00286B8C33|nr:FkbM family methyltransferase [Flavobacterium sp.]
MNKQIHSLLHKWGYKVTNIAKREKELHDLVQGFAVQDDVHNLVFRSRHDLLTLKKHFPELTLERYKEGVLARFNNLKLYIESPEEFFIIKEVFIEKDYNLLSKEKFVVFDIGMNIGISSLFFGLQKNVEKIYSFEPVLPTYNQAICNLELNKEVSTKIEAFNFGLGGATRTEKVLYNSQAKGNCGIRLELSLIIQKHNTQEIEILIQSIDTILPGLIAKHSGLKKVLKIDCEGAEYEILQKLSDSNLLIDIDILLIEWHDKGAVILENILIKNNFSVVSRFLTSITGMIYAFKQ